MYWLVRLRGRKNTCTLSAPLLTDTDTLIIIIIHILKTKYIVCFKTLISSIFYKYKNTRTYVVLHIKYTNLQTIVQRHTLIINFFYHHQFIHTQLMRSLCVLPYVPWSTIFSSIFRSFLSSNSHAFLFRLFNNSLFLSLFRFFCIFLSFLFNSTRQIV